MLKEIRATAKPNDDTWSIVKPMFVPNECWPKQIGMIEDLPININFDFCSKSQRDRDQYENQ